MRLLIPLLIIPLLGITPLPHEVKSAFRNFRKALLVDSPLDASANIPQMLEYFPDRVDLWELTAHYAFLGGDTELAVNYYQRAATLNSLSTYGFIEFGDAALLEGDPYAAVKAWESAAAKGGSSIELYSRLLRAHILLNDYDGIVSDLHSLTELDPSNSFYFYELGIFIASKQPDSAIAYLLRASELDPIYTEDVQSIKRAIDSARIFDNPAYTLLETGRSLANLNQWEHAARAFEEATQIRPDYEEAWAFLGESKQHLKDGEVHQEYAKIGSMEIERALEINPQSIAANTLMALYWQRQNRYDLALVYLHNAENIEPDNPTLQAEIGRTLAILSDLNKAQLYYERATELDPNDPHYWRLLADFSIQYKLKLRDVGLPAARQAILLNPNDPASLDVMGEVFILLEDLSSAMRFLKKAIMIDPNYAPAHLHLSFAYLLQESGDLAWKHLWLAATFAEPDSATAEQAQRMIDTYFP